MDNEALLATLRTLEVSLHQREVRCDRAQLDRLLDPRFREYGRSGRIYTKADILAEFSGRPSIHKVWSQDFRVEALAEGLALLNYKSAHIVGNGELERFTIRSSLWEMTERGWQLLFHQGTPTERFPRTSNDPRFS